jgi:site-specific DNA-methyltransferase (adenine-specific)
LTNPYYERDGITIYHGDCLEIIPTLETIDLVLTDPPYPDWLTDEYRFCRSTVIEALSNGPFVSFWTAKQPFPVDFDRVHVWDKKTGAGSEYELVYENGAGDNNWKVFRYYLINSTVAASFTGDVFNDHKSQKPILLMRALVNRSSSVGATILDPFMGSGTTLRAAKDLGRKAIGIELEERYCEIAANRLAQGVLDFST